MIRHVIYAPATGQILQIGTMPEDMLDIHVGIMQAAWLPGTGDPMKDYVDPVDATLKPRPRFAAQDSYTLPADNTTEINFALPNPTTVTLDGVDHVVTDGSMAFAAENPGTYELHLVSFPYISKKVIVTAHAPDPQQAASG